MNDKKKKEKAFYKYAMYYHLIDKGYSPKKAELMIKRMFFNNEIL